MWGHSPCGIFGYSHLLGGFAGGQAEYVRVPFGDVGPFKVNGAPDEQVLFLSDIFPTGYMAAEACNIKPGDTIAVWGCGPVGLFAIASAFLLGAERVIAIELLAERSRAVTRRELKRLPQRLASSERERQHRDRLRQVEEDRLPPPLHLRPQHQIGNEEARDRKEQQNPGRR